ncbi:MAG: holo-ACP synthase [Acidobacteriota bacterium]
MIIGIGTDIVDNHRIERSLTELGDRFRERIYTPDEIAYCETYARPAERYAARFAAKEAARKAFGAAASISSLGWRDVEIISSNDGAPQLRFHRAAADLIDRLKISRAHVTISHEYGHSVAFVILETDGAA